MRFAYVLTVTVLGVACADDESGSTSATTTTTGAAASGGATSSGGEGGAGTGPGGSSMGSGGMGGGSGGVGGGGSGGTGGASTRCPPASGDTPCDTCLKTACCDELVVCDSDPQCTCWTGCVTDPSKIARCIDMCGAPEAAAMALGSCGAATCGAECDQF